MSDERKQERLKIRQERQERQDKWDNNSKLQAGLGALGAVGNIAQSLKPEPLNKADATAQQLQNGVSSVAKSFPPIGTAIGVAYDIMNAIPGAAVNGSTLAGGAANVGNTMASVLLPFAGFFASKMRDFEVDERLKSSSSYGGTSAFAQEAATHAGGKFLFGVNTIRDKMNKAELQQNIALSNLDKADLANAASTQQVNSLRMQNMISGGYSPSSFVVGKKGVKIPEVKFAKKALKNRLDPYSVFFNTLPDNLRVESPDYNMKRYWELNGKPLTFTQGVSKGIFTLDPTDGYFHSGSVAYDKNSDTYEFVKSPNHPGIKEELDWYKSPEAEEFRRKYDLDISGKFYRYIPKKEVIDTLDILEEPIQTFKAGGSFNIIPEGALHKNKHNLDKIDEKFKDVTTKGIPIISEEGGTITQHAEIEKEEIIFNLEVTTKLEELASIGTDEAAIEAGELLVKEILYNTKDLTKKLL